MSGARVLLIGDALVDVSLTPCPIEDYRYHSADRVFDNEQAHRELGGAGRTAVWLAERGIDVDWVCVQDRLAIEAMVGERRTSGQISLISQGELQVPIPKRTWLDVGDATARIDAENVRTTHAGMTLDAPSPSLYDVVVVNDYAQGTVDLIPGAWLASVADKLVWDPHAQGRPPPLGSLHAVPNLREARAAQGAERPGTGQPRLHAIANAALELRDLWTTTNLTITVDARGAVSYLADAGLQWTPAPRARWSRALGLAESKSAVGAGDVFTAATAAAWASGASTRDVVLAAVEASAAYADGRAHADHDAPADLVAHALGVAAEARERGAVVVAVGGVFDVLHAGHVYLLNSAASLGDVVIVVANDDLGVRRLKGEGRPVFPISERAANLRALGVVDAVLPFTENTPAEALSRLRPDVFVKGDDYSTETLPERKALRDAGAIAMTVPIRESLSSTHVIDRIAGNASA